MVQLANVNFNTEGKFGFAGAFNGSSSKVVLPDAVSPINSYSILAFIHFNVGFNLMLCLRREADATLVSKGFYISLVGQYSIPLFKIGRLSDQQDLHLQ